MDDIKSKGIYQIRNKVNGKRYIGSTIQSFNERWQKHKSHLKLNKHHSQYLQRSWNKHGEYNFEFEIVEVLNDFSYENILVKEQWYLDNENPEYNCSPYATGGNNIATYDVIKDNKKITITNISKYCRDNNLKSSSMFSILAGRMQEHKGYTANKTIRRKEQGLPKALRQKLILISPQNEKTEITDVVKFMLDYNMKQDGLYRLVTKRLKQYKGWKLYNENEQ